MTSNSTTETARTLINFYAKRWGIETSFRDTQDPRFGPGLGWVRISCLDRLWLLNALAVILLTLLGASGSKPWAMTGT